MAFGGDGGGHDLCNTSVWPVIPYPWLGAAGPGPPGGGVTQYRAKLIGVLLSHSLIGTTQPGEDSRGRPAGPIELSGLDAPGGDGLLGCVGVLEHPLHLAVGHTLRGVRDAEKHCLRGAGGRRLAASGHRGGTPAPGRSQDALPGVPRPRAPAQGRFHWPSRALRAHAVLCRVQLEWIMGRSKPCPPSTGAVARRDLPYDSWL